MRSALLAVLTRLLFPRADEDLGVQHEHFRQRLFELPAEVHALAHRIDPQLGNMLDPLFAMDHEGERPEGVTLAVGTVAGRLAATAGSEGERAGKGVGREIETGDKLPFAPPKTVGGRAGGCGSHSILYVSIHADRFEKQTISSRKPKKMPDRRLRAGQERRLSPEASIRRGARTWLVQPLPSCQEQRVKEFLTHYTSYFAAQKSEPHFCSSQAASAGLAVRVDGLMKPDVWDVRDLRKKLRELLFELGVLEVGAV